MPSNNKEGELSSHDDAANMDKSRGGTDGLLRCGRVHMQAAESALRLCWQEEQEEPSLPESLAAHRVRPLVNHARPGAALACGFRQQDCTYSI